jgi:8-oxo-dGTP pyrophosphatase MutT (NUDIX family)
MKDQCSCGIILAHAPNGHPEGWLLCHPTNGGKRWDFPKGLSDLSEDHLKAALRELFEETGVLLFTLEGLIDLGQHPYTKDKDLHLFYLEVTSLNPKLMKCTSLVENKNGPDYPEMDAFAIFPLDKIKSMLGKSINAWIDQHVPERLKL